MTRLCSFMFLQQLRDDIIWCILVLRLYGFKYSALRKKYCFLLSVIFVDDVFSGNRFHVYKSCKCKFYVAKFRQECRTNSVATLKSKYCQNFEINRRGKRIVLLIIPLSFFQSNQNFFNIQKKYFSTTYHHF